MAINKKLIHFKTFENFNSQKLSANEENTKYTLGIDGEVLNGTPDILYQSIVWIKDTQKQWTHGQLYDGKDFSVLVEITYEELKTLRDNSQLVPGQQYRIIDYVTTTIQENTQSAGYPFDVIVFALSENTLAEEAYACQSEFNIERYRDSCSTTLGEDLTYIGTYEYNGTIYHQYESENGYQMLVDFNNITKRESTSGNYLYPFVFWPSFAKYGPDEEWEDGESYGEDIAFKFDINSFTNNDLFAWKLWYCLDNDTNRFTWSDATNGKGVIYRMIDEFANDCPYDFKNIQFKRKLTNGALDAENGTDTWCYTFNAYNEDSSEIQDASVITQKDIIDDDTNRCYGNIINYSCSEVNNEGAILNNIVFLNLYSFNDYTYFRCNNNSFGDDCYDNSFGNNCCGNSFSNGCSHNSFGNECHKNSFGKNCYGNSFGVACKFNSFGNGCFYNSFGNDCGYNSFGNYCYENSFGNSCYENSFGNYFYKNSFETDCNNNSFENGCYENSFGNYFYKNSFGNGCADNSFGNDCHFNSFGNRCYDNVFANICYSNSFGNECYRNSFGDRCHFNSFGNDCGYNSFGNRCSYNSFGNDCHFNSFRISASITSTLKDYVQYNHFDDGCSYNVIWNRDTTSSSVLLKNININRGVCGTSSSYNLINIDTVNSEQEINVNQVDGIVSIGEVLSIKYESLKTLRDGSQLIPGRQYRIIDYTTTTTQKNTRSAGHPFDVVVTALTAEKLSEEAQAIQNCNDGYFDESNLSAWKLWYCLDNDTNRFAWAGDEKISEIEHKHYDSSECTINPELIDGNVFITPFNFESCVWVDGDGDGDIGDGYVTNHDEAELVYEWGYFTDENDDTHLCLYKSDAELYEEEGQPDYGDKYLYRGVVNVNNTDYDYWQKWDESNESVIINDIEDYVYATTARIVTNPEAYSVTIETEDIYKPGKGVIYRMIDEFANDCPYDFKNIQFKRKLTNGALDAENGTDTWCYTFNAYNVDNTNIYDASVIACKEMIEDDTNRCYRNVIKEYYNNHNDTKDLKLNDIVFLNTYDATNFELFHCYNNSFGTGCSGNSFGNNCYSNYFGNNCRSNSFGNYCTYNSFGNDCWHNSFKNSCNYNSFGTDCSGNSFEDRCDSNYFKNSCSYHVFSIDCKFNSFGNGCDSNSFGESCAANSFGNECYDNSFGDECSNNSLSNSCRSNSFYHRCTSNNFGNTCSNNNFENSGHDNSLGGDCKSNNFGANCIRNSFGNNCQYNSLGGDCESNSFGNNCQYNSLGGDCESNSFGNNCQYNSFRSSSSETGTLKNHCYYNHFDDGCSYNVIWNSNISSSNSLKNINVNRGVSGKSSNYNFINIDTLNANYEIQVAKNSSGVIKVYCEADLIT